MVLIKCEEYLQPQWYAFMPEELFEKLSNASLSGNVFVEVDDALLQKLIEDNRSYHSKNDALKECANLNNQGIKLEKSGEENQAIIVYEKNILTRYPATHSYDRLIKIYRRLKRYDDEVRVLNIAIEVFSLENNRRFEKAKNDPKNMEYISDLQIAHETCSGFRNEEGWFIYVPYPLMKYIERLTKCESLSVRSKSKIL